MGKTYKAVEITKPGTFRFVERPVVGPGEEQVLIRVEACGVCHSDAGTVEGQLPGVVYPRVPGHEAIGRIEEVGRRVTTWKVGQRVGVGFFGGEDGTCETCRRGDTAYCQNPIITGVTSDGGYAEMMIAEARALALIPEELKSEDAAPLVCAGITTFNALRNNGRAGDTVAIQGIGGLGHLGVQYAKKMGFRTVAIGFGPDKEHLAPKLGAHIYIDAKVGCGSRAAKIGRCRCDSGDRAQRSCNRQPAFGPLSSWKARCGWCVGRSNPGQRSSADFWGPIGHWQSDRKSDRDPGHS
jgi:propanol-preferring alcohol dehydrogenase